jgi:hypothetical protein
VARAVRTPREASVPIAALPRPVALRQMRIAFESAVLLDLTSGERTSVITQLASLLLQATGQAAGDDDGEL